MASQNGRTLWQVLVNRNKRPLTPLELQHHNPLSARVGQTISFEHEHSGINFLIEQISVYETRIGARKFYHTDYHLKGVSLDAPEPIRLRLRLIPDDDVANRIGHKLQLLRVYDEMEWDEEFYDNVLKSDSGIFEINEDKQGNSLEEPEQFFRIEDVLETYTAAVTVLKDDDNSGQVDENEVERFGVEYWDYHRTVKDEYGVESVEYLTVEMKKDGHFFTFYRGMNIESFEVTVY